MSYCSTRVLTLAPLVAIPNGTASMQKPDTPSRIQKPMILRISAWTRGLEVSRVWLEVVEAMKVPSLGFLVVGPGGFFAHREKTMPFLALAGFLLAHTYQSRYGESSRFAKLWMRVGRMVDDEIDNYANAALSAAMGEFNKVAKRAIPRIDATIVGDIVAVVLAGGGLEIVVMPRPCK